MALVALVDCNNFFVSCERVFQPALRGQATVVLSANDGCAISRSQEAKDLGIAMGAPAHEIERAFAGQVRFCSANFVLYADLSRRVMAIIGELAAAVDIHSVDEAFLDCADVAEPQALARRIRAAVARGCGIPVSVGLAATRTLAKLANDRAKKLPDGVFTAPEPSDALLAGLPSSAVWGIGSRLAEGLARLGIHDARALRDADPLLLRRHFGVTVARTAQELAGEACIAGHDPAAPQQSLMASRSFGTPTADPAILRQAVAAFASRAGARLRRQGQATGRLGVWLVLGDSHHESWTVSGEVGLATPCNHTPELIAAAQVLAARLHPQGRLCRKAGVSCTALTTAQDGRQQDWRDTRDHARERRIMAVLDQLNARHGDGTVAAAATLAAGGATPAWHPRSSRCSPCYTTSWDDLPRVG